MSHTFREDRSAIYEHQPMSNFDTSHSSTSLSQSFDTGEFSRQQQPKMDSNQFSFGSGGHFGGSFNSCIGSSGSNCFSGSSSGFGGNIGERTSSHQNSGDRFTARNPLGNCYSSCGSRSFGNPGHKLESESSSGKSGQISSFSSRLPHLGSGGDVTVVAPGEGGQGKGGPPLDWDRLVDGVFTDEIAKLF